MNPTLRAGLRRAKEALFLRSLRAAGREQGLEALASHLTALGGIEQQYTTRKIDSDFLRAKVLYQNAFQVALAAPEMPKGDGLVVDIGDSSGRHLAALKALDPSSRARFLSVNLDPVAVEKIRGRGLEAVQARAEDLAARGLNAEVFLLFQVLEHLSDPFEFLHNLAEGSACRALVLTVPYVRRSRLGLQHIRQDIRAKVGAERIHLLELCPEDLRLLFAHTGWRVKTERIYLQYPRFGPLRSTAAAWRRYDFEGFYGAVLERDDRWSSLCVSWSGPAPKGDVLK